MCLIKSCALSLCVRTRDTCALRGRILRQPPSRCYCRSLAIKEIGKLHRTICERRTSQKQINFVFENRVFVKNVNIFESMNSGPVCLRIGCECDTRAEDNDKCDDTTPTPTVNGTLWTEWDRIGWHFVRIDKNRKPKMKFEEMWKTAQIRASRI